MAWKEVEEKWWWYSLECLPPALWLSYGFLVGEPNDHDVCTVTKQIRARYPALVQLGEKYYQSDRPMSVPEFRRLNMADVLKAS